MGAGRARVVDGRTSCGDIPARRARAGREARFGKLLRHLKEVQRRYGERCCIGLRIAQ
jgi:hypothetical protein